MGNELEDEKRMTRVETMLEAHETILLRIEAKMDEKFVTKDQFEEFKAGALKQFDELRTERRTGSQSAAFWVSAVASVSAVLIAVFK